MSVEKRSKDKGSRGGRKYALRRRSARGVAQAEVIGVGRPPGDDGDYRPLLRELIRSGEVVGREPLAAARDRHIAARAELPRVALRLSRGETALPTVYEEGLLP